MKILMLDNYDSFTYNLVQYLEEITGEPLDVFRNDAITLKEIEAYDTIILSPGPGVPKDAGIMLEIIQQYASKKNIFGVCLGLQAIGEVFGGTLKNLEKVYHGVSTPVLQSVSDEPVFANIKNPFEAARYHSWVIQNENIPQELEVTAVDEQGTIMAMRHKKYNVRGVQFHPESIMTPDGKLMLENFLEYSKKISKINTSQNEAYSH